MASKRIGIIDPSSSFSSAVAPPKRRKRSLGNASVGGALPDIKLFIVQAKLDEPTISELFALAEQHAGALCDAIADADVVITAVRMRKRLERHLDWRLAVRPRPRVPSAPPWNVDVLRDTGNGRKRRRS